MLIGAKRRSGILGLVSEEAKQAVEDVSDTSIKESEDNDPNSGVYKDDAFFNAKVSPSAEEKVSLHSASIEGSNLKISYSKNFGTCVHLKDTNNKLVHLKNVFCTEGENIEVVKPLGYFTIGVGQQVKLCHGNNGNVCSGSVKITGEMPKPVSVVNVTSPNGGEKFKVGDTATIKWETSDDIKEVMLCVYDDSVSIDNGSTNYVNPGAVSASQGYYNWKIDGNQLPKTSRTDNYRIKILSYGDSNNVVEDSSDAPFSIGAVEPVQLSVEIKSGTQPPATLAVRNAVVPFTKFIVDPKGETVTLKKVTVERDGLAVDSAFYKVAIFDENGIISIGHTLNYLSQAEFRLDGTMSFDTPTEFTVMGAMADNLDTGAMVTFKIVGVELIDSGGH